MIHLNSLKPYLLLINKGVEKGCIEIHLRNKINSLIKKYTEKYYQHINAKINEPCFTLFRIGSKKLSDF